MKKQFLIILTILFFVFIICGTSSAASGLVNSAQPKYQHDNQNTGQSGYNGSTSNSTKWIYTKLGESTDPIIGSDGTIYIGSETLDSNYIEHDSLYAINPNKTVKWNYTIKGSINSDPAIGSDGTIYTGSYYEDVGNDVDYDYLYAINPNGTLKWRYTLTSEYNSGSLSSIAIGDDGIIYFARKGIDSCLYAINLDGTQKWKYAGDIGYNLAIGPDGTIYITDGGYQYGVLQAINPNGTLKWNYTTTHCIDSSPTISNDGSIYIGCTDGLLAVASDGKLKWDYNNGNDELGSAPVISSNGTIYYATQYYSDIDGYSYENGILYAFNPNGTIKWKYTIPKNNIDSGLTIGADGTIYLGSVDYQTPTKPTGLYAINSNGTLKWISHTTAKIDSLPAINKDGTIYFSACGDLYAILDITPPVINYDPKGGSYKTIQYLKINAIDPDSTATIYYTTDGSNPRTSNTRKPFTKPITINKNMSISFSAVDPCGNWSPIYKQTYTITSNTSNTGLANSPQPQIRHDQKNTGQSQYTGSANNKIKEAFNGNDALGGDEFASAVIGNHGTIYVVGSPARTYNQYDYAYLYSFNSYGELNWRYYMGKFEFNTPVIGKDGTIYIGGMTKTSNYPVFYAINPNGTLKWKYKIPNEYGYSPVTANIDSYGTIYFSDGSYLYALNSDGTLFWKDHLGSDFSLAPAIGSDGTIYTVGYMNSASDTYYSALYAINPNNSIKWEYTQIYTSFNSAPSIGADGTVYVLGSITNQTTDTSTDYLFAINNDTLKWKYSMGKLGDLKECSIAIGKNGIIYIKTTNGLITLNTNGTKKWKYSVTCSEGSYPIINANGTAYITTNNGLLAINSNGTLKWAFHNTNNTGAVRNYYFYEVTPAIGSDGTIYTSCGISGANPIGDCIIAIGNKNGDAPPIVAALPAGGVYNTSKKVLLRACDPDDTLVTIYWTLDGSNPQTSSTRDSFGNAKYILITKTTKLRYSAKDPHGKWSPIYSQIYTIDKTAPQLSSTTPANLKTEISRTSTITIKFSENIYASTNYGKIIVKNLSTGKTATITKTINKNILYIKNSSTRSANTWYQVTMPAAAVKDKAGNKLTKTYTFKFKTGAK